MPERLSAPAVDPADEPRLRHPFVVTLIVCILLSAAVGASSTFVNAVSLLWLPGGAAAVLSTVGGWPARAAVVLATVLVDAVWIPLVLFDEPLAVAFMLLGVGIGTWILTGVAARLLAPLLLRRSEVTEPRDLLRFFVALAAPSLLYGAITGIAVYVALDATFTRALGTGLLWWIGNAAGAQLSAPVVAAFVCEPATVWRRRRWPALATLVLGWMILVPVMATIDAGYVRRLEGRWRVYTSDLAHDVFNAVEHVAEVTQGFATAVTVTRDLPPEAKSEGLTHFARLSRRTISRLTLLGWARNVDGHDRAKWEAERGIRVFDLDEAGFTRPAAERRQHFPLVVLAGLGAAQTWRGVDVAGDEATRARLSRAVDAAEPLLFRAPPALSGGSAAAVAVFHPVFWGDDVPVGSVARRAALRGFAVGILAEPTLVDAPPTHEDTIAADLRVVDTTGGTEELVAVRSLPVALDSRAEAWFKRTTRLEESTQASLFGRDWRVTASGATRTDIFEPFAEWVIVFTLALFLGGLLQALMLILTGREAAVRRVVAQRTATLEVIRLVQERYISGGQAGQLLDLAPIEAAIARATGATVEFVDCAGCPTPADLCALPVNENRLVLRQGDMMLGCFDLRDVRHREGLAEARALGAAATGLLASARADEGRREAERRFNLFMAHLPIIAFMKSPDGRYLYVNPAFESRFGEVERRVPGEDGSCVGRLDTELWDADTASRLRELDAATLAAEGAIEREERLVGPGGASIWRLYTFAITNSAGVRHIAGMGTDITAERESADQIRASLHEKEALLKEIHHRVKNNLQIVSSLLNLHRPNSDDPAVAAFVEESRNRIRSIALLHETLYLGGNLGRIDFGQYVRSLGAHLVRSFGPHAPGVSLDIEVREVSLGLDQAIPCGLILNELVSNALKYAFPEGRRGRIAVTVTPVPGGPQEQLSLVVADDGVGLADDYDEKMTRSLGLRLVFDLASQLGGKVTVTRQGGTRAELLFPKVYP